MFDEPKVANEYSIERQRKAPAIPSYIPSRHAARYRSHQCSPREMFSDVASGAPPSRRESASIISWLHSPSLAANLENIKIQDKKTINREKTLIKKCHRALVMQNRMAQKVRANLNNNKSDRAPAPFDKRRKHDGLAKDKFTGNWMALTAPLEDSYIYNQKLENNVKKWVIAEGRKRFAVPNNR